jgi:hypothetical protein
MEKLGVILLTYDRFDYARATLEALFANLVVAGPLHVHIADDGSPKGYIDELVGFVPRSLPGGHPVDITVTDAQRGGYGASYNLATQHVHPVVTHVLPLEDDWVLTQPLNAAAWMRIIRPETGVGCVRFGYLGFTQDLRGTLRILEGRMLLALDEDSDERHVCAGHPRIESVDWSRSVGPWPEGLNPGATEHEWCGRKQARRRVAWPMEYGMGGLFAHIGTIQARGDQR